MSGAAIREQLGIISERFGQARLERALSRLEPGQVEQLQSALPVSWVPIDAQVKLFEALAEDLDRSLAELHVEVARQATANNLRTIWRYLMRITTDSALVSRAPLIYARTYAQGELEAELLSPGQGELIVTGWPEIPEFSLRGIRIGIDTVLELAGREEVHSRSERTPDGARILISWRI